MENKVRLLKSLRRFDSFRLCTNQLMNHGMRGELELGKDVRMSLTLFEFWKL